MSKQDPETNFRGDYEGQGVWAHCDDCGSIHEIEQSEDYRNLIVDLCRDMQEPMQKLYDEFEYLKGGSWNVDRDRGLFRLTTLDGRVSVAPYGVVASWNLTTHSWAWAWALSDGMVHPAEAAACARLAKRAEKEGWKVALTSYLYVNEHEAWHLTNLAAHVNGWPLTYRAMVNDINYQYFAIGQPTWVN